MRQAYATAPLNFEVNQGQMAAGVDFAAYGSGYRVELADGTATLWLPGADAPVRLELVGAQAADGQGEGLLAARSNYLVGNDPAAWRTGIANYQSVLYEEVYQGIDVRYYGTQRQLEYDFLVAPGADARQIVLRFTGAESLRIDAQGDLLLKVAGSEAELRFQAPVSYQLGEGGRESVASHYVLHDDGTVSIEVGPYDATRPLVIDPILSAGSYFGDTGNESGLGIAVGSDGSVYVTGRTSSTGGDLAGRIGAGNQTQDIYVAKFNADLSALVYSTRVGGGANDQGNAIAVDAAGNVAVAGWADSNDFPMVNADDTSRAGPRDAVVFKLNASGTALVFSTFHGGNGGQDSGNAVAFDAAGNVIAAGRITDNTLLSGLLGPLDPLVLLLGSSDNAFVTKYGASGTRLDHTQFGGSGDDEATGLAVDASGGVYLVGNTKSNSLGISGGIRTHAASRPGNDDAFLARLDASLDVQYATYLGGDDKDYATAVAIDGAGKAYVVGTTDKPDDSTFATTANAYRSARNGNEAGYVRIYDTSITGAGSLLYSSLLDTSSANGAKAQPTGIALADGKMAIVGFVQGGASIQTTPGAFRETNSGTSGFLLVIDPAVSGASALVYGTYYGQNMTPGAVTTRDGAIYLVGTTTGGSLATAGADRTTVAGGQDAIVAIFGTRNTAPTLSGAWDLPAIPEDTVGGTGALVSSLIAGQVSDPDLNAVTGIAITAADSTNGTWQYSLNGTTWNTIAAPSATSALLLAADAATRIRFVPNANYFGASSITFRAWDRTSGAAGTQVNVSANGGSTAFSAQTAVSGITVTPVNDNFVDADESVTTAEDTPSVGGSVLTGTTSVDGAVTVTGFQVAGDTATYAAGATATLTGGSLTIAANGAYVFTPAANFHGSVPVVTYRMSDGLGPEDSSTLAIVITPVNDDFTDASEMLTTAEDTPLVGNLLAGTTSADGPVTVASFTVAGSGTTYAAGSTASFTAGTLTIAAGGAFTFMPAADFQGSVPQVSYLLTDGSSGDASTLDIEVTPVDDPSVLQPDTQTAAEDTVATGNVLANDSDPDDALAVTAFQVAGLTGTFAPGQTATLAGLGTLTLAADGSYTFQPVADFNGAVPRLTYTVDTGASSTLDIEISPVGDTFTDADEALTTAEDTPLAGNVLTGTSSPDGPVAVTGFHVAGDTTTYAAGATASFAAGALSIAADGSFTFTPAADFHGPVSASYDVSDGSTVDGSSLAIVVTPADDPFADADESFTTAEDTPASGNVLAGTSSVDGSVTVTTFTVAGDPVTYAAGATATFASGTLTLAASGDFTFAPAADFHGAAPLVSYQLTDGSSGDASVLALVVTPVDDPTVLVADTQTLAEDTVASGNVLANDLDVDGPLALASFQVAGMPGTFSAGQTASIAGVGTLTLAADGRYVFQPAADFAGAVPQATYTVDTGASSTLDLLVTAVVDPLADADESVSTAEDTPLAGDVLAGTSSAEGPVTVASFQVAGDASTYAAGDTASFAAGTLTIAASGAFVFTPAADFHGAAPAITYGVSDGTTSDASTLAIVVTPVDDPFDDDDESLATPEDTPLAGNVLAGTSSADGPVVVTGFQVAGNTTTFAPGQTAALGTAGILVLQADGSFVFTPAPNQDGAVPLVTYTLSDGNGSDTSILALSLIPVDDDSVLLPDTQTVAEGVVASGNVLANDSDVDDALAVASFQVAGDPGMYAAGQTASLAGIGTLAIAGDGSYTFAPLPAWGGTVPLVTYITNTGESSTLALEVTAVDDPTVLLPDAATGLEDTPLAGNVLANDSDPDDVLAVASYRIAGDTATYAAGQTVSIAGAGQFTLAADGSFLFAPGAEFSGAVPSVSYTVNTGASSVLALVVTPVDDPSVLVADSQSVVENSVASGNVLANDTDPDDALAVVSFQVAGVTGTFLSGQTASAAGVGSFVVAADGSYSFTPSAGFTGAAPQLTYTVNTGASTTLDVLVTAVNDPTVTMPDAGTVAEDTVATVNVLANDSDTDDALAVASYQVTGDPATYLAGQTASLAGIGSVTMTAGGLLQFVPAPDWNGSAPQVVYITNTAATAAVDVTVTPVNDAPVRLGGAPAPAAAVEAGSVVSLGLGTLGYGNGGGADEGVQTLTYTITSLPSAMST